MWCCALILYQKQINVWKNFNVIEGKNPSTTGLVNRLKYDIDEQNWEKGIENADKKLILQFKLKKLFMIRKLQRLKIKYLVLPAKLRNWLW